MIYEIRYDRYPQKYNNGIKVLFDAKKYIEAENSVEATRKFIAEQKHKNCYEIIYKAKTTLMSNKKIDTEKAYSILILSNDVDIYKTITQYLKKYFRSLAKILRGGKNQ